jgi:hypothetical protein
MIVAICVFPGGCSRLVVLTTEGLDAQWLRIVVWKARRGLRELRSFVHVLRLLFQSACRALAFAQGFAAL